MAREDLKRASKAHQYPTRSVSLEAILCSDAMDGCDVKCRFKILTMAYTCTLTSVNTPGSIEQTDLNVYYLRALD
jgi:hypothetical protein